MDTPILSCREIRPTRSRDEQASVESAWGPSNRHRQWSWLCLAHEGRPYNGNGSEHSLGAGKRIRLSLLLNKWVCCLPFIWLLGSVPLTVDSTPSHPAPLREPLGASNTVLCWFASFRCTCRGGIAGSYSRSIFNFRNHHTGIHSGCTYLHFHLSCEGFCILYLFPHSLTMLPFLIAGILLAPAGISKLFSLPCPDG